MQKLLDFYEKATLYERLTNLSYEKKLSQKKFFFDFISLEKINILNNEIHIKIDKQLELFLLNDSGKKGISPIRYIKNKNIVKSERIEIEDMIYQELFELDLKENSKEWKNKKRDLDIKYGLLIEKNQLLFSPVYIKILFPEEDSVFYLPVVTFNITEEKINIKNHSYKEGPYELVINLEETSFEYNSFVTNLFMNDSFKEIQNSVLYIANSDNVSSKKELFSKIYKNITEHIEEKDFKIEFPDFSNEKEPIGLFFNKEDSIEIEENFIQLKKNNSSLLKTYLTHKTQNNHKYDYQNTTYFGSMTDKFPLGKGQTIVMEKNQENQNLISVVGPPGTGKTTLFLSIIANNVVKRALSNIYEGKDYNNLMLITSTSNKAVENVYESLKEKYPIGFCYVGGNYENKKKSAEEIQEYIKFLKNNEYREGSLESIEKKIRDIVSSIEKKKIEFLTIKKDFKDNFGITKPIHLKYLNLEKINKNELNEAYEYLEEVEEIIEDISKIIDSKISLKDAMNLVNSSDCNIIVKNANKLAKVNLFLELFGIDKIILKKINLKNKQFLINEKDSFIHLGECIQTLEKYKKEINNSLELIEKDKRIKVIQNIDKNFLNKVLGFETFGEYFSQDFYKINYELFLLSKRYLEQKALKNKLSTIESLEFLASGDMYAIKDTKSFLEKVSLVYPVVTSTIAGFKYMFRNLHTDLIYESVLADEAGMIKVQDLLPILSKSERGIIVGDPKQLQPIVKMHSLFASYLKEQIQNNDFFNMYSPTEVSAYHRAAGTIEGGYKSIGYGIMLDEHRRCQKDIANLFIQVAEYEGVKIKTPKSNLSLEPFEHSLAFFNVIDRNKTDNHINEKEIETINKILDILDKSSNFDIKKDISIITPYKKQESKLIEVLGEKINHSKEEKKIGTVHKFQGVEYKVVIFSPVISKEEESLKFINKDPSMINVSISRAKELFIVVGDFERLVGKEPGNYIGRMAELMKKHLVSLDSIDF